MTDLIHPDRLAKIERMRAEGRDPFPARGVTATPIAELLAGAGTAEEPGALIGTEVTVAGRVAGLRDFGKLIFAPVLDRTGRIQVGLQKNRLAEWWPERKLLDGGDLVGITGELGFTQKGEPTVWGAEVRLLAKALAPPPEKWHGLAGRGAALRASAIVDLLMDLGGVARAGLRRSRSRHRLRTSGATLVDDGFLEVDTPILQPDVRAVRPRSPFKTTFHNAGRGPTVYLRIADGALPQAPDRRRPTSKRVRDRQATSVTRGWTRIRHNPEFTMIELYEAQADYRRMMELTETMIERAARAVTEDGGTEVEFRGATYDMKAPFQRLKYMELFQEHAGCDWRDRDAVHAKARELGIHPDDEGYDGSGSDYFKLANDVFEETVEPTLTGPVFVTDYPVEICPLSKASPEDPTIAERFELFVAGMELANAFSELNDPQEQERRFEEQVASKDPESPAEVDVDYVQALEYGMPPAGGLGVGIDRLTMVLTGQDSIRDVLLFPAMRPLRHQEEGQNDDEGDVPTDAAEETVRSAPE